MSSIPQSLSAFSTPAEYLRLEQAAKERHEFRDGQILAMAGGSASHSLIIANVIGEMRSRLKGRPCRVYDSTLRVRIPRKTLYTYPDASIICGRPELDPDDPRGETVLNPRVLIEVLSASTEAYDRGEKFARYREMASLEEYVLVSQDTPLIEVFLRQPDGKWLLSSAEGLDAAARLGSLEIDLPLAEVYGGMDLNQPGQ